jgi:hypothetical protein
MDESIAHRLDRLLRLAKRFKRERDEIERSLVSALVQLAAYEGLLAGAFPSEKP